MSPPRKSVKRSTAATRRQISPLELIQSPARCLMDIDSPLPKRPSRGRAVGGVVGQKTKKKTTLDDSRDSAKCKPVKKKSVSESSPSKWIKPAEVVELTSPVEEARFQAPGRSRAAAMRRRQAQTNRRGKNQSKSPSNGGVLRVSVDAAALAKSKSKANIVVDMEGGTSKTKRSVPRNGVIESDSDDDDGNGRTSAAIGGGGRVANGSSTINQRQGDTTANQGGACGSRINSQRAASRGHGNTQIDHEADKEGTINIASRSSRHQRVVEPRPTESSQPLEPSIFTQLRDRPEGPIDDGLINSGNIQPRRHTRSRMNAGDQGETSKLTSHYRVTRDAREPTALSGSLSSKGASSSSSSSSSKQPSSMASKQAYTAADHCSSKQTVAAESQCSSTPSTPRIVRLLAEFIPYALNDDLQTPKAELPSAAATQMAPDTPDDEMGRKYSKRSRKEMLEAKRSGAGRLRVP